MVGLIWGALTTLTNPTAAQDIPDPTMLPNTNFGRCDTINVSIATDQPATQGFWCSPPEQRFDPLGRGDLVGTVNIRCEEGLAAHIEIVTTGDFFAWTNFQGQASCNSSTPTASNKTCQVISEGEVQGQITFYWSGLTAEPTLSCRGTVAVLHTIVGFCEPSTDDPSGCDTTLPRFKQDSRLTASYNGRCTATFYTQPTVSVTDDLNGLVIYDIKWQAELASGIQSGIAEEKILTGVCWAKFELVNPRLAPTS